MDGNPSMQSPTGGQPEPRQEIPSKPNDLEAQKKKKAKTEGMERFLGIGTKKGL
jgi:hypothetical protein